ncbi:hypothetical protein EYF80_056362 [Liparis tanakae]|uniref:Uncharacterized protein n=1 Tax=Liparis tanakae TaxID=230148 RepID=A0A4Z2EX86_9TELE|nr:hypothetical protein EYF80_056362 [Liparis tanakae]
MSSTQCRETNDTPPTRAAPPPCGRSRYGTEARRPTGVRHAFPFLPILLASELTTPSNPNRPGEKKRRFSSIPGPAIRDEDSHGPVDTGGYIGSHGAPEIFGNSLSSGLFWTFKGIHMGVLLHPAVQLYQL